MEKKKEKNNKKEEPKKKKKAKKTTKKTINEKVRDVIRGKHALTINQVLQFLSGVIDGDVIIKYTKPVEEVIGNKYNMLRQSSYMMAHQQNKSSEKAFIDLLEEKFGCNIERIVPNGKRKE